MALHKDLEDVIDDCVDSQWIVVIEGASIIHFYESMDTLQNGGEFVTVVRSDDGEVVYMTSNANKDTGTVDEIIEVLREKLF